MIPGSDDDGSDRSQGGGNPGWIGLPQALHRKMSVFCARQKKEKKKGTVAADESPFSGEGKGQVCILASSYLFSVHTQRRSLRKLGETKVSKIEIILE